MRDIKVRDILTRSYGILCYDAKDQFGLSVVLPRNTLCDGAWYVFDRVAVRNAQDGAVPLDFAGVPEYHPAQSFVPLPEHDPARILQSFQLVIPRGVTAAANQRLRIFLRPDQNGVICGRGELMDVRDEAKVVANVELKWSAGG